MNLKEVLELHRKWLEGEGGVRAVLVNADLTGAVLVNADLTGANLTGANLTGANLTGADLKGADLKGANLTGADLTGADLVNADLTGANLTGADLWVTIGNTVEIKSLQLERWPVTYTADRLQIGCENHAITEWFEFSDNRISEMDQYALEWWCKYKSVLRTVIDASPARETGV
jgi:hypothetical protein